MILERLRAGVTQRDIAQEMGISRRQLLRKVKKVTGLSTSAFIRQLQMQQKNAQGLRPLEKKSLALALESESVFYRCQTIQSQTCLSASMVSTSDSARLLEKLVRKYPDCVAYTILPACGVCYLKTVASPVRAICNLKSQCNSTINDNHCPRSHGHCFQ